MRHQQTSFDHERLHSAYTTCVSSLSEKFPCKLHDNIEFSGP